MEIPLNRQKKVLLIIAAILFSTSFLLSACQDVSVQTITWVEYEPVYMSHEEFINSVSMEATRELNNPGKIYFYEGFLFVNEVNKGIHIINNFDPSDPEQIGFINIPANKDIAIRNDLLYADSQKDLLVFDISSIENPQLLDRIEGVFNNSANTPPGFTTQSVDESKGLVVDWEPVVKEEICEGNCHTHPANIQGGGVFFDSFSSVSSERSASQSGVGGSMARFTINGDYLYAVDNSDLMTFDVSSTNTHKVNRQHVGWLIETIFPYKNHLFIGSVNSMYIYDLDNPAAPNQQSIFRHATACDPVVVEGNYAYVTLRSGENCPNVQGNDQLEVIDVSDLKNPKNIGIYDMINPHGLGIDDGRLFISEGDYGLKLMDASDPFNIKEVRHIKEIKTFDVIPLNGVLMVTGESGIIQYDYSEAPELTHLSTIPVIKD
tara:strand:+ start:31963 stop:33264 length:1302 start_codon:yes stop_codon:yes gene_type:complete